MTNQRKLLLVAGFGILALFLVASINAFLWATGSAEPMPEALAALESSETVRVATDPWLIFESANMPTETGFVFYPGGKVDPRAYAPPAHAIAEQGYLVVIVPMPLNLAVLAPNRADDVIQAFPEIRRWVIGGHSLGGTMAASYAADHPDSIDGLILWASYPIERRSLAQETELVSTSIFGTLDGLVTLEDIEESTDLLPPSTVWAPIQGGNHAQFGWYGAQDGDNPATISPEAQQAAAVAASLEVLDALAVP